MAIRVARNIGGIDGINSINCISIAKRDIRRSFGDNKDSLLVNINPGNFEKASESLAISFQYGFSSTSADLVDAGRLALVEAVLVRNTPLAVS